MQKKKEEKRKKDNKIIIILNTVIFLYSIFFVKEKVDFKKIAFGKPPIIKKNCLHFIFF